MNLLLERPKLVVTLVFLGTLMFAGLLCWGERRQEERWKEQWRQDAVQQGRIAKEDGRSFQANPYIQNEYRELWRKGWREGKEVKE